jgi:hypothetical protein
VGRDERCVYRKQKKVNQMLKQVQKHDKKIRFSPFCHPEPGPEPCPETSSGSIELRIYDFGISVLGLEFGF